MIATASPPLRSSRDALGRRVEKVVTGATYRFIYSGVETVSVYTSTGTWKQDYVYGPVIDEVVMLEQADVLDWDGDSNTSEVARSWYRANALGSILRVEEPDRTEAVSYRYDPYGEVTITRGGAGQSGDPLGQHVTYTGRWRDEETGLYHYRARAYDPVRGRFLQRDPIGYSDEPTLHSFVGSSPLSWVDSDGCEKKRLKLLKSWTVDGERWAEFDRTNETRKEHIVISTVVVRVGAKCYEENMIVELVWRKYERFSAFNRHTMERWHVVDVPKDLEWWPADDLYRHVKEESARITGLNLETEEVCVGTEKVREHVGHSWEIDSSRVVGARRGKEVACSSKGMRCDWDGDRYGGFGGIPFPSRPESDRPLPTELRRRKRADPADPLLPPGFDPRDSDGGPWRPSDPSKANPK